MACCTEVTPTIAIGYAFGYPLTIEDDNGAVIDLTGWTLRSELRSVDADGDTVALIASFTVVELDYTAGTIKITLSSGDSASLPVGRYWADVAMTKAGEDPVITPDFEVVVMQPKTEPA